MLPSTSTPPRHRRKGMRLLAAWLLLAIGLSLVGFFGARAWRQYQYALRVERGEVQVPSLRGWMTLPYIARVYGVPESSLRATLGAPASGFDERSLREWIEASDLEPQAARAAVEALLLQSRAPGATRP